MDDLIKLKELDQETYMPFGAVEEQSEQIALFKGILHDKLTDDKWGDLL